MGFCIIGCNSSSTSTNIFQSTVDKTTSNYVNANATQSFQNINNQNKITFVQGPQGVINCNYDVTQNIFDSSSLKTMSKFKTLTDFKNALTNIATTAVKNSNSQTAGSISLSSNSHADNTTINNAVSNTINTNVTNTDLTTCNSIIDNGNTGIYTLNGIVNCPSGGSFTLNQEIVNNSIASNLSDVISKALSTNKDIITNTNNTKNKSHQKMTSLFQDIGTMVGSMLGSSMMIYIVFLLVIGIVCYTFWDKIIGLFKGGSDSRQNYQNYQ